MSKYDFSGVTDKDKFGRTWRRNFGPRWTQRKDYRSWEELHKKETLVKWYDSRARRLGETGVFTIEEVKILKVIPPSDPIMKAIVELRRREVEILFSRWWISVDEMLRMTYKGAELAAHVKSEKKMLLQDVVEQIYKARLHAKVFGARSASQYVDEVYFMFESELTIDQLANAFFRDYTVGESLKGHRNV